MTDDDFEYPVGGIRVKWDGWRQEPNRLGVFGAWYAVLTSDTYRIQTTLGHNGQYREWEEFDTSTHQGWPNGIETALMSNDERDALKERARLAILESL